MSMSVCAHTCRGYSAVTAVELEAELVERGPVKLHTQADPSILTPVSSLSGSPGAVEVCGSPI